MDFNVPKQSVSSGRDYIVVDKKNMGIWELINLGNRGGVVNLENNYAIEAIKTNSKWCEIHIIQYGINGCRKKQGFQAIKKVRDDAALKELRALRDELKARVASLESENKRLTIELSNYRTEGSSSVNCKEVEEI